MCICTNMRMHNPFESTCPSVNVYSSRAGKSQSLLVGGFKHFLFAIIYRIILPIDELIFFKMVIAPPTSLIRRTISMGHGFQFAKRESWPEGEVFVASNRRTSDGAYQLRGSPFLGPAICSSFIPNPSFLISGWWFGTWILWLSIWLGIIWNVIIPADFHSIIFQRG